MRECVDYQVVSIPSIRNESDWVSFSNAVRHMVSDGWEPVGGVSVVANRAVQAMAKYESEAWDVVQYPHGISGTHVVPGEVQEVSMRITDSDEAGQ